MWSDELGEIFGMPPGHQPTTDEVMSYYDEEDEGAYATRSGPQTPWATPSWRRLASPLSTAPARRCSSWVKRRWGRTATRSPVAGVIQDVTLWRDAESAVATQRRRFTQLATSLPFIIWTADGVGTVDYFNEAAERYSGMTGSRTA